ncbi:hypothetical protein [uncultured Sphingomonas sp.]|uniref:hypothetical protein n=1 Tax=uncultured Sphingomonas sp. TaxID=158754 RepID=UPI0026106BFC|nr:hypothetical protein [uncultured Sphingomonas sp.]
MQRPPSIVRYEQLYIASFILGLIVSALTWQVQRAALSANPLAAGAQWLVPAAMVTGIVIAVTLWYFTARRPSTAAKWVVVVLAAFSVLRIAGNLVMLMKGAFALPVLLAIVAPALYVAAAVLLFRPDARRWFGEKIDGEDVA